MNITDIQIKILLRIYDICINNLDEEIYTGLFYNITSKNYLWLNILKLERLKILNSYKDGRKKFIYLTPKGIRLVKALHIIDTI